MSTDSITLSFSFESKSARKGRGSVAKSGKEEEVIGKGERLAALKVVLNLFFLIKKNKVSCEFYLLTN